MNRVFKDGQKLQEMLELLEQGVGLNFLARKFDCHHSSLIYWRKKFQIKIKGKGEIRTRSPRYIPLPLPSQPPITHLYDTYIFKDKTNRGKINYQEYLEIYLREDFKKKYERKRTGNLQKAL